MCNFRQDLRVFPVPCFVSCQPELPWVFKSVLSTINVIEPADFGLTSSIACPVARRDNVEKSGTGNSKPISFRSERTKPCVCRNSW